MSTNLAQVEAMVGQLDDRDRAELRRRLTSSPPSKTADATPAKAADDAVENLGRVMDRIAAAGLSGTEVLFLDRESRACSLSMLACGSAVVPPASENTP